MIEVHVAPVTIELVAVIVVVGILLKQTAAFVPQSFLNQSRKSGFTRATTPSNSQNHVTPDPISPGEETLSLLADQSGYRRRGENANAFEPPKKSKFSARKRK
jgi:hypothetical protein